MNWYGARNLKIEEEGDVYYIPFKGEKYRDLLINVRVDVGPANLWSEIQQLQNLSKMVEMGAIGPVEYLENLPKGSVPNQEKLLRQMKEKAAAPAEGAGDPAQALPPAEEPGGGMDMNNLLAGLPAEYKQKMAGMTPEQQALLAQELAAQM